MYIEFEVALFATNFDKKFKIIIVSVLFIEEVRCSRMTLLFNIQNCLIIL